MGVALRRRSGLDDRHDETDRRQDVADTNTLGLGPDLHHRLAGIVDLPRDLPTLRFAARDGFLELLHDLFEGMAVAVVEDRHPGWSDRLLDDLLGVRVWSGLLWHSRNTSRVIRPPLSHLSHTTSLHANVARPRVTRARRAHWRRPVSCPLGQTSRMSLRPPPLAVEEVSPDRRGRRRSILAQAECAP